VWRRYELKRESPIPQESPSTPELLCEGDMSSKESDRFRKKALQRQSVARDGGIEQSKFCRPCPHHRGRDHSSYPVYTGLIALSIRVCGLGFSSFVDLLLAADALPTVCALAWAFNYIICMSFMYQLGARTTHGVGSVFPWNMWINHMFIKHLRDELAYQHQVRWDCTPS
jgi:hypothetical protein